LPAPVRKTDWKHHHFQTNHQGGMRPLNKRGKSMKHISRSGAVLAAAAFSLAVTGISMTPVSAQEAKVHCMGVNACKGQSACKTANSSCKGQNACKGQGFLEMTAAECTAAGGKVEG
jgi:hypothetical protein